MVANPQHAAQVNAAQQQAMLAQDQAKRDFARRQSRVPTDRDLPEGTEEIDIGAVTPRYRAMRDLERRLDAMIMRKRLDMQDSLQRNVKRQRTLRVWISNTAENQPWQQTAIDPDAFDFGDPSQSSFRVKIEARLLPEEDEEEDDAMDTDGPKLPKPSGQRTRFSHFFKQLSVEFERTPTMQGEGLAKVEWKKPEPRPGAPPAPVNTDADFDCIQFERKNDENVNLRISLVRDENPERSVLSPGLVDLLDETEDDRAGVVMGIWNYIRANKLLENEDSRTVHCDARLKALFNNADTIQFPYIPNLILGHLTPLPPITLAYTARVDPDYAANPVPTIYDLTVLTDDPLRATMSDILKPTPARTTALQQIAAIDESLALAVQALASARAKHTFYDQLGHDPVAFLKRFIASQQRDLEVILGEATRGAPEEGTGEEWRRGGRGVALFLAKGGRAV
ncbi:hypothetical protein EJ06DRAFT_538058 [Trichodelitschia bisporula]|uniref:DM2 domain-containing protein n=1 Tax=Trichodelitschia bisporula TaxID=703511 RepID=A0A6G1HX04_9PEZI|nr:hypothetical protein EJ06DRAFT_538058 [Trichodelitschia bisporula]